MNNILSSGGLTMENTLAYGLEKFVRVKVFLLQHQVRSMENKSVGMVFTKAFQKVKSNPVWISIKEY